jgi:hypothetical protein
MTDYLVSHSHKTVHLADYLVLAKRFTERTRVGKRGKDRALADRKNYDLVQAPQPPPGPRCRVCVP